MRDICVRIVAALVCCILAGAAYGQSTAQVSGAVKDQTGAVLPGAEVRMTQTETGLTRSTVTDETGSYSLPNLPIGDRKSTRLNSSHVAISYAVFCLKKKTTQRQ